MVGLYAGTMAEDLAPLAPARLVPVMRTPEGTVVGDTLAMAETLAERHPEAGLWPDDPGGARPRPLARRRDALGLCRPARRLPDAAAARSTRASRPSEAVQADLARLETLWSHARTRFGADAPLAVRRLFAGRRVLRPGRGADRRLRSAGEPRRPAPMSTPTSPTRRSAPGAPRGSRSRLRSRALRARPAERAPGPDAGCSSWPKYLGGPGAEPPFPAATRRLVQPARRVNHS